MIIALVFVITLQSYIIYINSVAKDTGTKHILNHDILVLS